MEESTAQPTSLGAWMAIFLLSRIGDPDLKEAIMSILYAEPRTNNLKELAQVRQTFLSLFLALPLTVY
jgi:hypothetical protein